MNAHASLPSVFFLLFFFFYRIPFIESIIRKNMSVVSQTAFPLYITNSLRERV
jgi:hypothetical protein